VVRIIGAMAKTGEKPNLTTRQMAFVCAYLQCFNATKAAKIAGYSPESAYELGSQALKKVEIAAEIHRRLDTEGITPERIKVAWAEIAFDTDMADFETAVRSGMTLKQLKDEGFNTQLIKSLSIGKNGTKVEMHSKTEALDKLTKIRGMYIDKIEHSGQLDILQALTTKHGGATDDRLARAAQTAGISDTGSPDGPVGDSET